LCAIIFLALIDSGMRILRKKFGQIANEVMDIMESDSAQGQEEL
jgi:hypothetical protein